MASKKRFQTTSEVIEILKCGTLEGKVYKLPDITLERKQYEDVNAVLVALGAKWKKKAKGHVFDYDIKYELQKVIETGMVTDWKKSTDFFHTPDAVVSEMLGLVTQYCQDKFTILEPSAGQGHILDMFKEEFPNAEIIAVEQNPLHCERLREKGYNPTNDDFMNVTPVEVELVLMNPPFTCEMEHIRHAFEFLIEGGQLISVTSSGILEKSTKQGKEFKQWFDDVCGSDYILPPNSFKESGTSVNTKMLYFEKGQNFCTTEEVRQTDAQIGLDL